MIPTPIGKIIASLSIKAGLSLDLVSMLSASNLKTSLVPSGSFSLFASAAWSFVIGKIGAGVQVTLIATLPIEFGVEFSNPAAYVVANLSLYLSGKAGVYYVVLKLAFKKKCWGPRWFRFCFWIPRISYTNPRFIVSVKWNSLSTIKIIPYSKINLLR